MSVDEAPELGVFARVFPPGPPDRVAAAIRRAGFTVTQLNLSALGRPTLDPTFTADDAAAVRRAFERNGVRIWGVSGTFNAIDPDVGARRRAVTAARRLLDVVPSTGAAVVTLCTGTRNPRNMWGGHPDDATPAAWEDLLETLDALIPHAAAAGVRLGVEPEPGNVVRDAAAAARLLVDLGTASASVGVVLDPANLITLATAPDQRRILGDAFALLGGHVVALHAKDVSPLGSASAGSGVLDYDLVAHLYRGLPRPVPVIAQDLTPEQAPEVYAFLSRHWPAATAGTT